MKAIHLKAALAAAVATAIISCGGGGGGVAGIGGSGFTSTGTVTGFGSVFVNGVEFETEKNGKSTTYNIDDNGTGSQDDLAIGMVVTVTGTANGATGTASSISFDGQLQGPVSGLTAIDQDGLRRSFTVLGTTVRVNIDDTAFDISPSAVGATSFDFANIIDTNNVEISGFFNAAGELVATRVELKAVAFNTSEIVELNGTVSAPVDLNLNTQFTLNSNSGGSVIIDTTAQPVIADLVNNQIPNGSTVQVKGNCTDSSCTTIVATRIEGQSGFDDADKISIEGVIAHLSGNTFEINGTSVDVSATTSFSPGSMVLRDGLRVEVEGPIASNTITANTIELRGGSARVHATVSSVDPSPSRNFVVSVNGQDIAVTVTTYTQIEGTVTASSFVRIRGFENGTGVTATSVDVRTPDSVIVQGNITSTDFSAGNSITVLGVMFTVDANTEYQDINDNVLPTETDFVNMLNGTPQLVKVKDKDSSSGPDGIADEVEFESD